MISQMGEEMNFCVLILIEGASSNGAAFNKCACSCYSLQERRNHQITLIAADEQPHIELFHAPIDVLLVTTKRVDVKDVTRHESG